LYRLLTGKASSGSTALFLTRTILTSVTGFPLPPFGFDPPHAIGIIAIVLLAVAVAALYAFHLAGSWRWIYIGSALTALYLNVFVGVIQAFHKLSFWQPLAPTQSELPFVAAQLAMLAAFVVLGVQRGGCHGSQDRSYRRKHSQGFNQSQAGHGASQARSQGFRM
jgi:hypothetical protein